MWCIKCVHAQVGAHVCVRALVGSRLGREQGVSSRALAAVKTNMYLTNYSRYLAGFCESLSPPSKSHTGLKNV